jgi:hypothetical protein
MLAQGTGVILRQPHPASSRRNRNCTKAYHPARTFRALIDLIRAAEARLSACGHTSAEARIHVLRGIYYGTTWSADYAAEGSEVRNLGFQVYTGSASPDDPRACLDCGLFEALRQSQDVSDRGRSVDVGHLIIGLDARRSSVARDVTIPSQGASGLAISTWVGDLGGGAAMLAVDRVRDPTRRAITRFHGSDFGGSINLEGDVAGYVVGADPSVTTDASAPVMPSGGTIADALEAYLLPAARATGPNWNSRAASFLRMMGGAVSPTGVLTNPADVISSMGSQIGGFACWYLVNRLRQTGRLNLAVLKAASQHIDGASHEMAEGFVEALEYSSVHPGSSIQVRGTGPSPTPPGTAGGACAASIHALEAAETVRDAANTVGEWVEQGLHSLGF